MIYIYLDKNTVEYNAYGSIVALCGNEGLKPDKFYNHFGRNKKKYLETDDYILIKLDIIRSNHK
jgi:hypothetical protein